MTSRLPCAISEIISAREVGARHFGRDSDRGLGCCSNSERRFPSHKEKAMRVLVPEGT